MNASLEKAIRDKTATVGVIGLGYVGLPLIRAFVAAGFHTMGFDCDQSKVTRLAAGQSYIKHIAAEWIARCVGDGTFVPTADMAPPGRARRPADLRPHAVERKPRPRPDLHRADRPRKSPRCCGRGQLVVLESTTYPGTTREVVLPILAAGGLAVGKDFFLAFSPEREDPGNPELLGRADSQGRRRHRRRQRAAGRSALPPGRGADGAGLAVARSPRPPRSWKTPTARSTSPWSTS